MKINSFTEGGVYEVNFGHHSDLYGYTTLMSDIMKLYAIAGIKKKGNKTLKLPLGYDYYIFGDRDV